VAAHKLGGACHAHVRAVAMDPESRCGRPACYCRERSSNDELLEGHALALLPENLRNANYIRLKKKKIESGNDLLIELCLLCFFGARGQLGIPYTHPARNLHRHTTRKRSTGRAPGIAARSRSRSPPTSIFPRHYLIS
jgi:hypothetical protein